mmetsp:Transcript_30042/g.47104  ORF Transcript_30042/g.47104 Transcript_30042/m.47104 type:complete len:169 (+) Transcript_30042:461-967(+)
MAEPGLAEDSRRSSVISLEQPTPSLTPRPVGTPSADRPPLTLKLKTEKEEDDSANTSKVRVSISPSAPLSPIPPSESQSPMGWSGAEGTFARHQAAGFPSQGGFQGVGSGFYQQAQPNPRAFLATGMPATDGTQSVTIVSPGLHDSINRRVKEEKNKPQPGFDTRVSG